MLALLLAAANPLAGDWTVDLTAKARDAPYLKGMTLAPAADGGVTGRFYDSDLQSGRWKTQNGRTCASFRTTDGQGPYHSSVCASGGRAEGQTWAEHRNFVFVWTARPATAADRAAKWW